MHNKGSVDSYTKGVTQNLRSLYDSSYISKAQYYDRNALRAQQVHIGYSPDSRVTNSSSISKKKLGANSPKNFRSGGFAESTGRDAEEFSSQMTVNTVKEPLDNSVYNSVNIPIKYTPTNKYKDKYKGNILDRLFEKDDSRVKYQEAMEEQPSVSDRTHAQEKYGAGETDIMKRLYGRDSPHFEDEKSNENRGDTSSKSYGSAGLRQRMRSSMVHSYMPEPGDEIGTMNSYGQGEILSDFVSSSSTNKGSQTAVDTIPASFMQHRAINPHDEASNFLAYARRNSKGTPTAFIDG